MAGSFSSKKVARAARTGGGARKVGNGNLGYYSLLVVLAILGTTTVVLSRNDRLNASNPGTTAPLAPSPTRSGDHWYEAYGIYICDKFVDPIKNENDPYGISTKSDGVIYVHPYEKKYAGRNSTLGRFAKAVDLKLERNSVQVPGDPTVYKNDSSKCGDKGGELVIKQWDNAKDDKTGQRRLGDPNTLLLNNNHAIVIAFVPKGKDVKEIPLPPSVANLAAAAAKDTTSPANAQSKTQTQAVPVSPGGAPAAGGAPATGGAPAPATGAAPAPATVAAPSPAPADKAPAATAPAANPG